MLLRPLTGRRWTEARPTEVSFAPCIEGDAHFARPNIAPLIAQLRKVNGGQPPAINSSQSLTECTHRAGNRAFWESVVAAVFQAGLSLGTKFTFPTQW
jgi:hypothetical protein